MDRYWLLTWTTYGTCLPGDPRGFVGRVRIADGIREEANQFLTEPHRGMQPLLANSVQTLKQTPVRLNYSQADARSSASNFDKLRVVVDGFFLRLL